MPLIDMIPESTELTADLINKWNSLGPILASDYKLKDMDINGNIAYKYRNDFEGLLLSLDIPRDLVYPHIIANGLKSSEDYNGDTRSIVILDSTALLNYLFLFTQQ